MYIKSICNSPKASKAKIEAMNKQLADLDSDEVAPTLEDESVEGVGVYNFNMMSPYSPNYNN